MKHLLANTPLAALLACLPLAAALAQPVAAPAQAGRWVTESGNLEVDIAPCGDAWCGTVTRVIANRSMSAPGSDMQAADSRPALGMVILTGLRPGSEGVLDGQIYNRENGKTYSARLTPDGADQMQVRAYIGMPMLGKTQLWRRPAPASTPAEAAR